MSAGDWAQVSVTLALVIVTGFYVWQTRRIVKNMERDREEMHRPVLNFQLISWFATTLKLRIQNVGSGPAIDIEGTIESTRESGGSDGFPWSYPSLGAGQYEEFGFPVPEGAPIEARFALKIIRESIIDVRAKFKYKSAMGVEYELDELIQIKKVTDDWTASKMLVTQDSPERVMIRIASALEGVVSNLGKIITNLASRR